MLRVVIYSALLFLGLNLSQFLPGLLDSAHDTFANAVRILTMTGLAFIMIHVGFEFHIDKRQLGKYGWDYVVAFTAASFPWILVTLYFVLVMLPSEIWFNADVWKETLLAGRFAAPTSAGVLFSMLAAAGLSSTWLFKKARVLAIFDDLDTVLLMLPLKMLMVGIAWQLGVVVVIMVAFILAAYIWLHKIRLQVTWPWVLTYSFFLVALVEALHYASLLIDPSVPMHIEVLLPAFVIGCVAKPLSLSDSASEVEAEKEIHRILEGSHEKKVSAFVSAAFMLLVGLSIPPIFLGPDAQHPSQSETSLHSAAPSESVDDPTLHGGKMVGRYTKTISASQPSISWSLIALHVFLITLLSNLGKMFPLFCYRKEVHWRHRLALSIGMWPRGEVGAGVLVLSLSYGIGGPIVSVAMLSLALNLVLTGAFIILVKRLIEGVPEEAPEF